MIIKMKKKSLIIEHKFWEIQDCRQKPTSDTAMSREKDPRDLQEMHVFIFVFCETEPEVP